MWVSALGTNKRPSHPFQKDEISCSLSKDRMLLTHQRRDCQKVPIHQHSRSSRRFVDTHRRRCRPAYHLREFGLIGCWTGCPHVGTHSSQSCTYEPQQSCCRRDRPRHHQMRFLCQLRRFLGEIAWQENAASSQSTRPSSWALLPPHETC